MIAFLYDAPEGAFFLPFGVRAMQPYIWFLRLIVHIFGIVTLPALTRYK
jgi:hypothetical protein